MLALAWLASFPFWCQWCLPLGDASESAGHLLEVALWSYSSGIVSELIVPEGFDAVEAARCS